MQMVECFDGITSERRLAMRCADSLSSRQFLNYGLHEATGDHPSLTVIRRRLAPEIYEKVFKLVLKALRDDKVLQGRKLAIDASVMEANASKVEQSNLAEPLRSSDEDATADLTGKLLEVEKRISDLMEEDKDTERFELVAADRGYSGLEEVNLLQEVGIERPSATPNGAAVPTG